MTPERLFADTNLFVRYLTNDMPEQAEAVEQMLRRAAAEELVLVTNTLGLMIACTFGRKHFSHLEGVTVMVPGADPLVRSSYMSEP